MAKCFVGGGGGEQEGSYVWRKQKYELRVTGPTNTPVGLGPPRYKSGTSVVCADSYYFDEPTGKMVLVNPTTITMPTSGYALNGKFVLGDSLTQVYECLGAIREIYVDAGYQTWFGPDKYNLHSIYTTESGPYVVNNKVVPSGAYYRGGYKYVKAI